MASGFWAIRMTERAKLIPAFVCPFGHFQWVRTPFGLKNAPLVYQTVIINCLWGFVRLPPEEEAEVDQDVLDFLHLECPEKGVEEGKVPALTDTMTVFQRNIPTPSHMGSDLGRSSYIDDIAHGAVSWDQLCDDLNKLLFRLRYWNISVSLPKSEFGKRSIPYRSHEISAEGIRATPKIVKGIRALPFPNTLKGVQSFLGRLNYYHKFVEDFPAVAAVLYELTDEQIRSKRDLSRAKESFEILKRKIVSTPLLRQPDRTNPFVIIPHANRWAACAVLGQEYDGVIHAVRYTGRVLNDAELRYHIAEKEAIAVLRVLKVFRTLIEGCPLVVYTRYSVLKGIIQSKTADGRCVPWGVTLSHWNLDIRKVKKDEGVGGDHGCRNYTKRAPGRSRRVTCPGEGFHQGTPSSQCEDVGRRLRGRGIKFRWSCEDLDSKRELWLYLVEVAMMVCHVSQMEDVTVDDAEYNGLLKGLQMVREKEITELVVVGDSRIVIQQVQGLINCHQPNLQKKLAECESMKAQFTSLRLVHVMRDFNQAADYITSKTLVLDNSWDVEDEDERHHLEHVSKIPEQLMKSQAGPGVDVRVPESLADVSFRRVDVEFGSESAPLRNVAQVMAGAGR